VHAKSTSELISFGFSDHSEVWTQRITRRSAIR